MHAMYPLLLSHGYRSFRGVEGHVINYPVKGSEVLLHQACRMVASPTTGADT